MPLYYITGLPGSGKSTVLTELRRRGYEAYGTDEDNLAAHHHSVTGEKDPGGQTAETRTEDWRKHHEWKIPVEKVEHLRLKASAKPVFLCGVVANDAEFWDNFTQVFCLYATPEEIKHRIVNRVHNDFGKNAHELAEILEWAAYSKDQYGKLGATLIDATQSVEKISNEILSHVS